MPYNILSPLKTGKGNNLKVGRKVLESVVKTLNTHSQPLPVTPDGQDPVAFEYGALTPAQQLGAISGDLTTLLGRNIHSKGLKFSRANLGDVIAKLTAISAKLTGKAKDEIAGVISTFQNLLTPPKPVKAEKPTPDAKSEKGKATKPADKPAPAAAPKA